MSELLLPDLHRLLQGWEARWGEPDERERAALNDLRSALTQDPPALWRQPWRMHVTFSSFVLSPDLSQTLLVHHAKGGFWVQPGGHPEPGDASVEAAALRELTEETRAVPLAGAAPLPLDLDHHALPGAFGHCASHLDVGVVVLSDPGAEVELSEESTGLDWFPVDDLPSPLPSNFEERLTRILDRARTAAVAR